MEEFDYILSTFDAMIHSPRKRHLIGGLMLSLSLFFGGVTVTILTLKEDE